MKRRVFLIIALLALLPALTGCGGKKAEARDQAKETAIAALSDGRYDEALAGFNEALSMSDGRVGADEIDICYYKAVTQYLMEDITGACDTLDSVIAYDEKNADAYYLRGSIYLSEGENELGISDMKKSASIDTSDYERVIQIFAALNGCGQREAGLEVVSFALSSLSDSREDMLWKARLHLVLDQFDEAQAAIDRAEGAGDTERLLIQGEQLLDEGQYENALDCFEKALSYYSSEDEKVTRELSGETYRRLLSDRVAAVEFMGEWSEALKLAREYIAVYPQDTRMIREIKVLATR